MPRSEKSGEPQSHKPPTSGGFPKQQQPPPGVQSEMTPEPLDELPGYRPSGKLEGKVALITGADSGIGRAVAIAFAAEGADIAFIYLSEDEDAEVTRKKVQSKGRQCLALAGDVGDETFCRMAVDETIEQFGQIDILVNNAAEQHVISSFEELTSLSSRVR